MLSSSLISIKMAAGGKVTGRSFIINKNSVALHSLWVCCTSVYFFQKCVLSEIVWFLNSFHFARQKYMHFYLRLIFVHEQLLEWVVREFERVLFACYVLLHKTVTPVFFCLTFFFPYDIFVKASFHCLHHHTKCSIDQNIFQQLR